MDGRFWTGFAEAETLDLFGNCWRTVCRELAPLPLEIRQGIMVPGIRTTPKKKNVNMVE